MVQNRQEVLEKVIGSAKEVIEGMATGRNPRYPLVDVVEESSRLEWDLNFDSLDLVTFVMYLEDDLELQIPDEAAFPSGRVLQTIGEFTNLVCKKLGIA